MLREFFMRLRFIWLEFIKPVSASHWQKQKTAHDAHVFLVAGFMASGRSMVPLKLFLEHQGFEVHLPPPKRNLASVGRLAQKLAKKISTCKAKEIYIVAHSLGGIITTEALRKQPALQRRVRRVITLGTPWGGTQLGSAFVWTDKREYLALQKYKIHVSPAIKKKIHSLSAQFDEVVWPKDSVKLPAAVENRTIPVRGHLGLILSLKSWRAIHRRLKQ